MPKQKDSTSENFNELLAWLHQDGETAARMYENIRGTLIGIFRWRGCSDPEGMADETIIRVTRRVSELVGSYVGAPERYFYGVAKNVLHEYGRNRDTSLSTQPEQFVLPELPVEQDDSREHRYDCLERCLKKLTARERKLIVRYYDDNGSAKIAKRKKLAAELGIDLNALRVRVRRIRGKLQVCIEECLAKNPGRHRSGKKAY
jgi:RNA polymerase sigma factor (sigma-70 family)